MSGKSPDRLARFSVFATLGILGTTQELAQVSVRGMAGADPEVVAEETLSLVSVTTARAAEVGLKQDQALSETAVPALYDLPFIYRDYLIGGAMILDQDASMLDESEDVYQRLQRKQDFYAAHFPQGTFPAEAALTDKMELWMGRISPPSLPKSPSERLHDLDVVSILLTHLKLVLAFGRRGFTE